MPNKPIIITAFANDYENGQHLKYLSDEIDGINNAMNGRRLRAFFDVVTISKASIERIEEKLQDIDYQNRIVAFHYGGHADSQHLMLQSATGTTELAKAETLADFLGKQERLQLVFLNGCSTEGQVEKLKEVGVCNIIATDRSIEDAEASRFAVEFYQALAAGERKILTLFKEAQKILQNEKIRATVKRKLYSSKQPSKNNFAWALHELKGSPKEGLGEWFVNRNIDLLTKAAPTPTEAFIGRTKDLKEVHTLLEQNDNVVLVNGIGGIGKSTLAQAYWHKHQHQYTYLAYIVVTNDNIQEAFLNSGLEDKLNIIIPEKTTMEERYQVLQRELSALQGIKLLIVDNINEPDAVHQFKLPNWKVMMTSRASIEHYTQYTVGILSEEDAQSLFLHYHPAAAEKVEVLKLLLEGIGYHTLAIELLAKNLQQLDSKGYDINDLYQNLKDKGLLKPDKSRLIRVDYPTEQKVKYEKVIEAMFDLNPLVEYAQWLLLQFAVLPAIPIAYADMKDFLQIKEETEENFDETLEDLVERGWLEKKESGYKMHQVVQEVIRVKIEPNGENCGVLVIGLAWKLKIFSGQNPLKNSHYLAYTDYLLTKLKKNKNRSIVLLLNNTALMYQETGAYSKAVEFNLKSIKIQQNIYPIEYSDIAASYNNIAINYRTLGNFNKSINYNLKSIALREKVLHPLHSDLALSYCNIGDVYQVLGFFDKALKFQLMAIRIREKTLTPIHPNLGQSYNNIAVIYYGNRKKAD